jgi:Holliday junction resolvase RusA-like endonuclease
MIYLTIQVEPMGAVRMTQRGKYTSKKAQRYLAYKSHLQWQAKQQSKGKFYPSGALEVSITFKMPIPESYSKKIKESLIGEYHIKKPDTDNLVKGVFDALNKIVWQDDNQVSKVFAKKVYSNNPGIEVEVGELKNGS